MGRYRFVQPQTIQLPLSEGDWVEVKKELTIGENRAALNAIAGEVLPSGSRKLNYDVLGLAELSAWIVDWSFCSLPTTDHPNGRKIPFSITALKDLTEEDYREVETVVQAHIAKMHAESAARKKARDGEHRSVPTSSSAA
jgi:hypothetical protein